MTGFLPVVLPAKANPPEHYRLELHATHSRDWLTSNKRLYWRKERTIAAWWRAEAANLAHYTGIPHIPVGYVLAELRFTDRRRRDPGNWAPTIKPVLDGLVDAGVFTDDSYQYVRGPDIRLGPIDARLTVVMHIWPLPREIHNAPVDFAGLSGLVRDVNEEIA